MPLLVDDYRGPPDVCLSPWQDGIQLGPVSGRVLLFGVASLGLARCIMFTEFLFIFRFCLQVPLAEFEQTTRNVETDNRATKMV